MTRPNPSNLMASVRQRLANLAEKSDQDFQRVLVRYALERLIYRMSKSPYSDRLVLKGAMMFLVWSGNYGRPTRDLDFLGYGEPSPDGIQKMFQAIGTFPVEADAMEYPPQLVRVESIREGQVYGGIRVSIEARLGNIKLPLRIDVGFGDVIVPQAVEAEFPTLLSMPTPHLRAYTRDSVIAEKSEAMVKLGMANSRMKDFYDIYRLAQDFEYEGSILVQALQSTFEHRETAFPLGVPVALTFEFSSSPAKQKQWQAFLEERELNDAPQSLSLAAEAITQFLQEPLRAARLKKTFPSSWAKGGPWRPG